MKDLMTTQPLTMSSKEIADLCSKPHGNVKRTIEYLGNKGLITFTQIDKKSTGGRPRVEYHIGKRNSYVVVAQLSPEFTARLVDRWQELEEAASKQEFQLPDFTNPSEAARAWADQFERGALAEHKVEQLTVENEVMYNELHLVTTDEYRALNHLYMTHGEKVKLGKIATRLCQEREITLEKQVRTITKYGKVIETKVNVYPRNILDEAYALMNI